MRTVAIIPARGGSTRIPRKNIRDFCGKPMIAWSISAAEQSGCFDRIIVSTDDAEVAEIAQARGAETPFVRPAELSGEHTGTRAVMNHALRWLLEHDERPEFACCLYATAPFVRPEDLRAGLDLLAGSSAAFVFSVTTFASPIQRAVRILATGRMEMIQPDHAKTRSQDLEPTYHDTAQFSWGRTDEYMVDPPVSLEHALPLVIPRYRVQDVDTPEDWRRAELLFQLLQDEG